MMIRDFEESIRDKKGLLLTYILKDGTVLFGQERYYNHAFRDDLMPRTV